MTDNWFSAPPEPVNEQPLESWKEIAAYLKRDVRTVKRWEKGEGLPVRRHQHLARASVYAYPSELDAWKAGRDLEKEEPQTSLWQRPLSALATAVVLLLTLATVASGPLVNPPGAAAADGRGIVVRQIWAGPGWWLGGSPSPDGRYLSYIDWTTGDLALRDLVAGTVRHLTKAESGENAFDSCLSPDSQEVAYTWFGKDGPDLRLARMDGSTSRILFRSKEAIALPSDWSPDGKYLLSILMKRVNQVRWMPQIALISVADGSVRVLRSFDWGFTRKAWFSPDGRYIAYDFPPRQDSGNRDLFLLAADGSREIHLVEHPADDMLLGWTPDGDHILFASDRSGSMAAWMIRVVDGKPQGSPELVKRDIGAAQPLGFTRAGSYYYGVVMGTSDVYTAEFDPEAGRVLTQPQNATQRFAGSNSSPAWSPDGQFLAYISSRLSSWIGGGSEVISIRSLKTGEERDLSPNLFEIWGPMRWSPDGRALLVGGKDRKLQQGLYLIDAQTGEATAAVIWGDRAIAHAAWFPDGKRLLYLSQRGEAGTAVASVVIRELATSEEKVLFQPAPGVEINGAALSPDGQQVALTLLEKETQSAVLKVLPVAGGQARELVRAKEPERIAKDSLSWSSDSRYVVFSKGRVTSQGPKTELFAISPRGGEPHALGLAMDSVISSVSFHSDGRHLAFAVNAGNKMEIWVMENFLPEAKAAK